MVLNIIIAILLGLGIAVGVWQYSLLNGKIITVGTVTDLPMSRGSKGGATYGIVASFQDDRHLPHTYTSGWKSSNPGCKVGDTINLYYDRENPDNCGLSSFNARYGFAFGCIWIGLLIVVTRVVWMVAMNQFDRIYHP